MEHTSKSSIQERKIRVLFLPADPSTATPPRTNGLHPHDDESLMSSPSPVASTPQQGSHQPPVGPVSHVDSRPAHSKHLGEARESAFNPATSATSNIKSSVGAAAAGVARAIPTTQEELQAQLADAKATIAKLKQQAETSSGLRQRKAEPTREAKEHLQTTTSTEPGPTGGVTVQLTAILCLLSFLIAYFLF